MYDIVNENKSRKQGDSIRNYRPATDKSTGKKDPIIMKRIIYYLVLGISLTMVSLTAAPSARAALGEAANSVMADRKALSAARGATVLTHANYTVQEFESDAITVREYISLSGIVFGIAWNGLGYPDLTQLLGSYANEYWEALRRMPRMHGQISQQVKTDRVVVEKWGHMRNLEGRAYAPALIPQGVTISDIK